MQLAEFLEQLRAVAVGAVQLQQDRVEAAMDQAGGVGWS
jgi:hypothetical protein